LPAAAAERKTRHAADAGRRLVLVGNSWPRWPHAHQENWKTKVNDGGTLIGTIKLRLLFFAEFYRVRTTRPVVNQFDRRIDGKIIYCGHFKA